MVSEVNMKFRTPYDLGDFNDDEKDFPLSLTDPTCCISLEIILQRCLRGEIPLKDFDGLDPEMSVDDQFATENQFDGDFDLSDLPPVGTIEPVITPSTSTPKVEEEKETKEEKSEVSDVTATA